MENTTLHNAGSQALFLGHSRINTVLKEMLDGSADLDSFTASEIKILENTSFEDFEKVFGNSDAYRIWCEIVQKIVENRTDNLFPLYNFREFCWADEFSKTPEEGAWEYMQAKNLTKTESLTKYEIENYSEYTLYTLGEEIGYKKAKELFAKLIQYYVENKTEEEPSIRDIYRYITYYGEMDTNPKEEAEYYIQAKVKEKEDDARWLARYK